MTFRRIFIFACIALILFLGLYSWNVRTQILDEFTANLALEVTGGVLNTTTGVKNAIVNTWDSYFDLVNVREENQQLKARIAELEATLAENTESLAELARLRELLQIEVNSAWRPMGARVLSGRLGPGGILQSVAINRGYLSGGRPGTPLITQRGLVGRVLRASPHSATALLLTDPSSRIAVLSQRSRTSGILIGRGAGKDLEVNFVSRGSTIQRGEILITSGLDGKYPKGIPVARVLDSIPSQYSQFLVVDATPLADVDHLEEVVLLDPTGVKEENTVKVALPDFMGPPPRGVNLEDLQYSLPEKNDD